MYIVLNQRGKERERERERDCRGDLLCATLTISRDPRSQRSRGGGDVHCDTTPRSLQARMKSPMVVSL